MREKGIEGKVEERPDGKVDVSLLEFELWYSSNVGYARRVTSIASDIPETSASPGGPFGLLLDDIGGAQAEMALAKYLGVYWDASVGVGKRPDLPHEVQCRHTFYDSGKLVIRVRDKDREIYVLVTGRMDIFTLHGWMTAGEAKEHSEWVENPNQQGASWFVPQKYLHPMKELRSLIHKED